MKAVMKEWVLVMASLDLWSYRALVIVITCKCFALENNPHQREGVLSFNPTHLNLAKKKKKRKTIN